MDQQIQKPSSSKIGHQVALDHIDQTDCCCPTILRQQLTDSVSKGTSGLDGFPSHAQMTQIPYIHIFEMHFIKVDENLRIPISCLVLKWSGLMVGFSV